MATEHAVGLSFNIPGEGELCDEVGEIVQIAPGWYDPDDAKNPVSYSYKGSLLERGIDGLSYLRDTGSEANPILSNSNTSTKFNGVDQSLTFNFGSNKFIQYYADDTLVELTASTLTLDENKAYRDLLVFDTEPTASEKEYGVKYTEKLFAHYNVNDAYSNSVFSGNSLLNMPLNNAEMFQIDYSKPFGGELLTNGDFTDGTNN